MFSVILLIPKFARKRIYTVLATQGLTPCSQDPLILMVRIILRRYVHTKIVLLILSL